MTKYINSETSKYASIIQNHELSEGSYEYGSRIFNRALELTNRCFICDEVNLHKLTSITLKPSTEYRNFNHLLLCKEHAEQYNKKELIIRKNGYPYLNGKRLYQHLDIGVLKKIRVNLSDFDELM